MLGGIQDVTWPFQFLWTASLLVSSLPKSMTLLGNTSNLQQLYRVED
jgi:hypothetical protein